MPYTIRFLHDHKLAVLSFTGVAAGETFAEALEHLFGHLEWRPGYDRIWNELGIKGLSVSFPAVQEYQRLTHELSSRAGAGRAAGGEGGRGRRHDVVGWEVAGDMN